MTTAKRTYSGNLSKSNTRKFPFITERTLRKDYIELTAHQSCMLRRQLPSYYFMQPTKRGAISWNWILLQDYLLNGDTPGHKALVEEYLATLPTAV